VNVFTRGVSCRIAVTVPICHSSGPLIVGLSISRQSSVVSRQQSVGRYPQADPLAKGH
jgi:hypothetical protein